MTGDLRLGPGHRADADHRRSLLRRGRATVATAVTAVTAVVGTVALATLGTLVLPGVAEASFTLRDAYEPRGRHIGVAVNANKLGDPVYTGILDREFSSVTPENELEWDSLEPAQGQFVFTRADQIVAHARANGMQVRGRSLVAPTGIHSAWFGNLTSASSLRPAMNHHITAVLTHYRGQIPSWGVVTEAFTETGARWWSRFEAYLGPGYIEEAFRTARAADPGARLCYNDYNIDDFNRPKTQAVYAMVRDFKARGVPIDCVGLASHFTTSNPVPSSYQRTIAQFAALGVQVQISELDIAGSGATQADNYRRVATACLVVAACTGITVWGVRDSDSWRSGDTPVLFDASGNRKPAYYGMLATQCCSPPTGVGRYGTQP